jgi:hypothetical protein
MGMQRIRPQENNASREENTMDQFDDVRQVKQKCFLLFPGLSKADLTNFPTLNDCHRPREKNSQNKLLQYKNM